MTLNWQVTAADCRVSEYLAPLVARHITYHGHGRWAIRTDTDYARPWENPGTVLNRLIHDLGDFLPEGKYWDRARYRMRSDQNIYLTRRALKDYLDARERGQNCACGDQCRYPADPYLA